MVGPGLSRRVSGGGVKRVPEPELMEAGPQVDAYASADFSEPNEQFCALFQQRFAGFAGARVIDLGCGPADIPIRLALAYAGSRVFAVDGSAAMLARARRSAVSQGVEQRLELIRWHIGNAPVPQRLAAAGDAVISNSLLHHLVDPQVLWTTIRVCAAPGAIVLVMDLRRPESRNAARRLVEQYADQEPPILKQDFFNSLLAAYREDEIRDQLANSELKGFTVEQVSDRHLAVYGGLP
ncbi:MAG: class I SAM-dependent methyltransferase [Gammaproteobacteria bacterium]|nr:class I SAM-dependent methyltransferase [Gammaproteobacteria bacterium]